MVSSRGGHTDLIPTLSLAGGITETIQDRSDLVIAVAHSHSANDIQSFHRGGTFGGRAWPLHFELSVHSAFPVDREMKSSCGLIGAYDDLFKYRSEDHLLQFRGTLFTFPDRGKVIAHRSECASSSDDKAYRFSLSSESFCFVLAIFSSFSFQRRSSSPAARRFLASTESYCSKAFLASYSNCSSLLIRAMRCAASPTLNSSSARRLASTPSGDIT